ncbi:MAG: hypothetical protein HND55_02105 [Pseudomonadota bacterium]|nr:MAG: hypothetical protein HND55_02105 [Pseudomonadota bacterium]
MKNLYAITAIAGILTIASLAAMASGSNHAPPQDNLNAISRLHHWSGIWQGSGWAMSGPGQRQTFEITEQVTKRLGGTILLVEGRGTSTGPNGREIVTHEALGVVYYDSATQRYNFQTHDMRGGAHEVELEIDDQDLMRWSFRDEGSGSLLRFEIEISGDTWHETGQISPDGGQTWYPMLEMTLDRQQAGVRTE